MSDIHGLSSIKNLLQTLSDNAGKHGIVEAAVINTNEIEDMVTEAYLEARQNQNTDPTRKPYSLFGGHNCGTLMCDALDVAGRPSPQSRALQMPSMVFGNFLLMPNYFGVSQVFSFTPSKESVTSKICYTDDNGKRVCK